MAYISEPREAGESVMVPNLNWHNIVKLLKGTEALCNLKLGVRTYDSVNIAISCIYS
ncbi:MAG: hypothetical protein AAFQ63_13040 [Cyanobacteria bacterium J06621_11]